MEEQESLLKKKFSKMEDTKIGKILGVEKGVKLQDLPLTDYKDYEAFFNNLCIR